MALLYMTCYNSKGIECCSESGGDSDCVVQYIVNICNICYVVYCVYHTVCCIGYIIAWHDIAKYSM